MSTIEYAPHLNNSLQKRVISGDEKKKTCNTDSTERDYAKYAYKTPKKMKFLKCMREEAWWPTEAGPEAATGMTPAAA